MTRENDFVRTISAEPDDDPYRLVYADWLEEHGDVPRAEFIRCQVEYATLAEDSLRRRQLAYRAWELEQKHGGEWLAPLRPFVEEAYFSRGLVERVVVSARSLVEHGDELFRLAPVRRLRVSRAGGYADFVEALPPWARIVSLDIVANRLRDDVIDRIEESPALDGLKRLVLSFNQISWQGAWKLGGSRRFDQLEELQCGGNPLGAEARTALSARFGPRLHLDYAREPDPLYSFQGQDEGYWAAGVCLDATQILATADHGGAVAYRFDFAGHHLGEETDMDGEDEQEEAFWRVKKRLGFRNATVRIRRFHSLDGDLFVDYPRRFLSSLDATLDNDPVSGSAWELLESKWFSEGQFECALWDHPLIDGSGAIVAT